MFTSKGPGDRDKMGWLRKLQTITEESDKKEGRGALEFAWQIHTAVSQWSGRADTKASILLTLELAVLGSITALTQRPGRLAGLSNPQLASYRIGVILLSISIVLAGLVVLR
jgi:hypothetical protein